MTRVPQVRLGSSGPIVSRLIFGTEHIIDRTPAEGGHILAQAYSRLGITHWDTAPAYRSHPQVAQGLKEAGRSNIVVTSKTPARSAEKAAEDLELILQELDIQYLDICFLHNVAYGRLPDHLRALEPLLREKEAGRIRHLGLSSHSASVIREAAEISELEIICAPLNLRGTHIDQGSREEMEEALKLCHDKGKGTYVIKILGVGDLAEELEEALAYVASLPFVDALNIGMRNLGEAEENASLLRKLDHTHERG